MIEEAEFSVTANLTIVIPFSPIERPTPLTRQDAIANAMGSVSDNVWEALEAEGWSIEFEAERL